MSTFVCYIIAKQNPPGGDHEKNCVHLKWNPAIFSYNMSRFLPAVEWEEASSDWSIVQYDRVKAGDRFFMLRVGLGMCGIAASGKITSDPTPGEDWSDRGRKV